MFLPPLWHCSAHILQDHIAKSALFMFLPPLWHCSAHILQDHIAKSVKSREDWVYPAFLAILKGIQEGNGCVPRSLVPSLKPEGKTRPNAK